MRVAIVSRPFAFHGGLENATTGLVRELVRQGYDLHLFTPPGQVAMAGVVHHRLPVIPAPPAVRHLSLALAARVAVRRARVDIVQSHERTLFQHVYRAGEGCHRAYLAVKARRRGAAGKLAVKASPSHLVLLALERRIFASGATRWIVAIARQGAAEIRRLYGVPDSRLAVIYNGVDQERFHPDHRARFGREIREAFGIPRAGWLVLMVGSGFARKGLGPLIEGLARLRDPDARLLVVGKGDPRPYRALAERLGVASRLAWAGPRSDVERFYAAADLVALPSLYEPFGNVHLEALAAGVPVLASDRSGGAEVVSHGETGWILHDPEDPAAIAGGLEALRSVDRGALAARAREAVRPFTFTAQAQAFAGLYRTL